mgnify:CR=1 FL=1
MNERLDATGFTRQVHREFLEKLPFGDRRDFEEAARGFIAPLKDGPVLKEDGDWVFDPHRLDFIGEDVESPDTVNPSLWRQGQLCASGGLFKVTDGIWQLRGFDIANMTLIEGKTGLIVVDPLTARESASAALAFARKHLGDKPVSGIVFTHSHADHFGGALGIAAGYFRGWVDRVVSIIIDCLLSIPALVLAIMVASLSLADGRVRVAMMPGMAHAMELSSATNARPSSPAVAITRSIRYAARDR